MTTKKTKHAAKPSSPAKGEEPAYVVQIQDPRMVRKQLLESLRDLIIFMQGYEQFRQIQEQKVARFTELKNDVKELNHLLDTKLRRHFPRGKVKPLASPAPAAPRPIVPEPEEYGEPEEEKPAMPIREPRSREAPAAKAGDLDELEEQLRDIEEQLRAVK